MPADKKKIVCLTHVLRYSPYFLKLKEMIDTKRIGDLVSIQHFEPVDHIHMSHSYVRGSWHDSVKSTPLVLAKSSHDLDILYWMIGKPCRRIAAFGGLKHFKSENAPKGSTERCTDGCAAEATCPVLRVENLLSRPNLAVRIRPAGGGARTRRSDSPLPAYDRLRPLAFTVVATISRIIT